MNKSRNLVVKYHFHDNHDPYISLKYNGKNKNYSLAYIMLASVFPTINPMETVDHIDDNSKNHNITNLCWMSLADPNSTRISPASILVSPLTTPATFLMIDFLPNMLVRSIS